MEPALVGSALIAAVLLYYASKKFNLREFVSPVLLFVVAFFALVFGYNYWEKNRYNPVQSGSDMVVNVPREGGSFSLPVYFNDTRVNGIIDTGATNIVIPFELAVEVGVDIEGLNFNVPVSTANGMSQVAYAKVGSLRVGDTVSFQDVEVYVAAQGSLAEPLLGLDFLKRTVSYSVSQNVMELRF